MFPKNTFVETEENALYLEFYPFSLMFFCESNKKKSDGNQLTPTQHLPDIGCGTLPNTILTLIKTDNAQ